MADGKLTPTPAHHRLLYPPDGPNLVTLGDRMRLLVRLHARMRALEAHESRQTRHARSHAGDFAEFRAFLHAFGTQLIPLGGGSPHVQMLMDSIRSIRASRSTLPIEVAFRIFGPVA
ncbi:hypothetical protein M427DRAFT_33248 [Gonapodya prolifera JEL478]|uniref:Uncharacterized protein n=1 Tax=Gonapodya prolifera (strain JEL478) TaxID=1344416 RepID=A0A139ABZ1_GONPJ|nr:hypothetical protein M427DRAFT_33248 [Gonapodya prolifera JEL478]|eukprot:KXS14321.1 hypothetical protein M427DRAFT_33248 [Gonapodya prolifera JEL478]